MANYRQVHTKIWKKVKYRLRSAALSLSQAANAITGNRISDYLFYRWVDTKTLKDLNRYIDLTTYHDGTIAGRLRALRIRREKKRHKKEKATQIEVLQDLTQEEYRRIERLNSGTPEEAGMELGE